MAEVMYRGTGRRKDAIARVRLVPGEGNVMINERPMAEYFGKKTLEMLAMQPLELTENTDRFDVICKVEGGGISGQAGAVCLGIARALLVADDKLRSPLKKAGFLTRDSRMKERKKYGLKKARKASQFSKR